MLISTKITIIDPISQYEELRSIESAHAFICCAIIRHKQNKCHLLGVELIGCNRFTYHMIKKHSNLVKIGNQIKAIRASKGFSQERLAAVATLGRTYMGRVERGEQNISIQNLIKIAFILSVDVGELIPPLSKLENPAEDYFG